MKKVYTVTFHRANNYGALLQAYALQKVLSKKYETRILDYDNKYISNEYKIFKKIHDRNIKHAILQFCKDCINIKKEICRRRSFDNFRKNLLLTEKFDKVNDVVSNYPKADVYITGSDQVWNSKITNGIDLVYTLSFKRHDFKKIAYAASSGNNATLKGHEGELIEAINDFDSISVREKPLKDFLESKTSKKVDIVLDPSLLLTKEDWGFISGTKRIINEKYIFVYCGEEPQYFYDIVNELARRTGYLIVYFGRRDRKHHFLYKKKSCYEYGPIEFVNLIKFSEYVVTASFHGTALATILNVKMFIVLNNYSDRLTTLLELVGLNKRIATSFDDFENIFENVIDWVKVNRLLSNEREKSINWIYNSIDTI